MPTKKWFVVDGENEMGPLGPNGLRKLVRKGEVTPQTMVRREDHEFAVRADHLRGLFAEPSPGEGATASLDHHERLRAKIHGPFTSLRVLGWANAASLCLWILIGVYGLVTAAGQRGTALQIVDGKALPLTDAGAPFLGLGGPIVAILFLGNGVLFIYWLWCARINLPHLIHARIRYAPSWTILGWVVPILNLVRPYQVLGEVDRLSAEAAADGDASVHEEQRLLLPWWICTLLLVGFSVAYRFTPVTTAAQIATAAWLHIGAAVAVILAAASGAAVFLRITYKQESAHDRHPEPVQLHHELRGRRRRGPASA